MTTPSISLPAGLSMRPARDADKAFLSALYRSTRADLSLLDGEPEFVESLLDMQTRARNEGYGAQFPNAMDFIVELHWESIGRATVDFGHNEVRLVDMAFIPAARGKGYGKAVLQSLQLAAAKVSRRQICRSQGRSQGTARLAFPEGRSRSRKLPHAQRHAAAQIRQVENSLAVAAKLDTQQRKQGRILLDVQLLTACSRPIHGRIVESKNTNFVKKRFCHDLTPCRNNELWMLMPIVPQQAMDANMDINHPLYQWLTFRRSTGWRHVSPTPRT